MVRTVSISMREHVRTKIWDSKPKHMSFSEWIETLALRGLENRPVAAIEGQDAPARISTSFDSLPEGFLLVEERRGRQRMLTLVEVNPQGKEEPRSPLVTPPPIM